MSNSHRWDQIYLDRLAEGAVPLTGDPSLVLVEHQAMLPDSGTAIDVAAGLGRNSMWLARNGLDVQAVDVSMVAVEAITAAAVDQQLAVRGEQLDVEVDGLGARRFDVIAITYFLDRTLLASLATHLNPAGVALFAQPTVTNLERNAGPSERFSLAVGEVIEIAEHLRQQGLEIVTATEEWRSNGAHEGWLVVRRPDET